MFIGKKIKILRIEKGIKQVELARLLKVSTTIISHWEAEKCHPSLINCQKLARIFGVSLDTFVNGTLQVEVK